MHVADGVLSGPVWATGFAAAAAIAAVTLRKVDLEDIPKISVVTSVFFVASLIHFPVGPSSLHLILNGLVGIVLGVHAFPAIMLGIVLQAILFGHGGVSVIGVNTVMMGTGAMAAHVVWMQRHRFNFPNRDIAFASLGGAVAIIVSGFILAISLYTTGEALWAMAGIVFVYHIPLMVIEGAVAGACIGFLLKVKPGVLSGNTSRPAIIPNDKPKS